MKPHRPYRLAHHFGLLSINLHVNLVLQVLGYAPSVLWALVGAAALMLAV